MAEGALVDFAMKSMIFNLSKDEFQKMQRDEPLREVYVNILLWIARNTTNIETCFGAKFLIFQIKDGNWRMFHLVGQRGGLGVDLRPHPKRKLNFHAPFHMPYEGAFVHRVERIYLRLIELRSNEGEGAEYLPHALWGHIELFLDVVGPSFDWRMHERYKQRRRR